MGEEHPLSAAANRIKLAPGSIARDNSLLNFFPSQGDGPLLLFPPFFLFKSD